MNALAGVSLRAIPQRPIPSDWWSSKGVHMHPDEVDARAYSLRIAHLTVAELTIRFKGGNRWMVDWSLKHADGHCSGAVMMNAHDVRAAFGLLDATTYRSGGDVRVNAEMWSQGQFVRSGHYLNIPCAGRNVQGDPNISIEVTDQIRDRVQQLLQLAES